MLVGGNSTIFHSAHLTWYLSSLKVHCMPLSLIVEFVLLFWFYTCFPGETGVCLHMESRTAEAGRFKLLPDNRQSEHLL